VHIGYKKASSIENIGNLYPVTKGSIMNTSISIAHFVSGSFMQPPYVGTPKLKLFKIAFVPLAWYRCEIRCLFLREERLQSVEDNI
jgi:hypothetical protein